MSEGKRALPPGWSEKRIADVLQPLSNGRVLHQGKSPRCERDPSPEDSVWGVLKTTAIQAGEFQPEHNKRLPDKLDPDPAIEVHAGDLLITCAGPRSRCGVPCLVRATRPRLMLSGKMYRFRADEAVVDRRYLEYFLLSPDAQAAIDRMKTGTSESGLNLTHAKFSGLPVSIPPLAEQRRIIEVLDEHLSRLDAALTTISTVRAKATQFRRSLLHSVWSGSLLHPRLEGELPDGWEDRTFEQIASVDSNLVDPAGFPDLPHIAPNTIEGDTSRLLPFRTVAEDGVTSGKHRFFPGHILYSKIRPYLNKVTSADFDGLCSADMYPVSTTEDARWLLLAMLSPEFVRQTSGAQTRTVLPKINIKELSKVRVPVPPASDQIRLVELAQPALLRLDATLRTGDRVGAQLSALRRSLLHAAFTGKLTDEWREAARV